ncbi:MAG: uncharacterized protein JWN98_2109 [Abditibacteriota bacterium]|nr:uncharacterized protein [Abditibacteriota bacterium]
MSQKVTDVKSRAVVIFARRPLQGEVKTRLGAAIGGETARQLYVAMLRDTLDMAQQAGREAKAEVEVAYTPVGAFDRGPGSLHSLWRGRRHLQRGSHLGERMANTLSRLHQRGAHSVLIIGSDAPDLSPLLLCRAFDILNSAPHSPGRAAVVLGPSEDGGFYLIGARRPTPLALFDNVAWSTQSTLAQVMANAQELAITADASSLPIWRDVDTANDLRALGARLGVLHSDVPCQSAEGETLAPHTTRWLREQSTLLHQLFATGITEAN